MFMKIAGDLKWTKIILLDTILIQADHIVTGGT